MPISPMDEFLAHQTTDTFDRVYTSDKNFYDRYYFNCHPSTEDFFLVTGMGQYPNLGVTDAFVTVSHRDKQYTVRSSRELGSDRFDTSVGPLSVEVLEGLQKLRVRCEPNEWGVSFDMTWNGAVPALEEPKSFTRTHNRITMDTSRYAQVGTWEGTLEVGGETFEVTPDRFKGARDRSWGVRPVGEPEAPGIKLRDMAKGVVGLSHHWLPMQFDDYMLKVNVDAIYDGTRTQEECVKVWNHGVDKDPEFMGRPEIRPVYQSGTRELESAEVAIQHPSGKTHSVRCTPLRTVYLFGGSGYRADPEWGHGVYKGPLEVQGVVHEIGTKAQRAEIAGLNETLSRFELDTGEVGYGMHENLVIGTFHPDGFDAPDALAP